MNMENEFYITSMQEDCEMLDLPAGVGMYPLKVKGRKSVKIELENSGAYDVEALKAMFAAGKKVKLVICE